MSGVAKVSLAAGAALAAATLAGTIYVTSLGNDSNTGLSWLTAKLTVQAAINALPANGGIVEVGYGTFASANPITLTYPGANYNVTIRGQGMGQTYDASNNVTSPTHPTTISNTGTGDAIQVTGTSGQAPPSYGFLLEDLGVVGNTASSNGLTANFAPRILCRRVAFDQHAVWGVECKGGVYWPKFEDCVFTRNGLVGATTATGGFYGHGGGSQFNLSLMDNCILNYNYGFGAYVTSGTAVGYVNTDFRQTLVSAFATSGTGYNDQGTGAGPTTFVNCWFEKNAGPGFLSNSSLAPVNFLGCNFPGDAVQTYGISVSGTGKPVNVIGCTFLGHSTGYSIISAFEAAVYWSGCTSTDSTAFIKTGAASVNIPIASAPTTGTSASGMAFGQWNQTLSAAGAVTFNATEGNTQICTLGANATSSSIINPTPGQYLTIVWKQNATGGFTYAWPATCTFARGVAPPPRTAANAQDSVTFRWDGTTWQEVSRPVAAGGAVTTPTVISGVAFTPSANAPSTVYFQVNAAIAGSYILTMGPSTGAENTIGTGVAMVIGSDDIVTLNVPLGWQVVLTVTGVTIGSTTVVTTF